MITCWLEYRWRGALRQYNTSKAISRRRRPTDAHPRPHSTGHLIFDAWFSSVLMSQIRSTEFVQSFQKYFWPPGFDISSTFSDFQIDGVWVTHHLPPSIRLLVIWYLFNMFSLQKLISQTLTFVFIFGFTSRSAFFYGDDVLVGRRHYCNKLTDKVFCTKLTDKGFALWDYKFRYVHWAH